MIIVGLGNPGDKYSATRHNLGFTVLNDFAKKLLGSEEVVWDLDDRFQAEILKPGPNLWLVRPQTYMNFSGKAVSAIARYFKVPIEELVVVYDDLDLPLGKIKIRQGGSGAGHHGVESIIDALKSDQFIRLRLGIGPLQGSGLAVLSEHSKSHFGAEHFVIEPFKANEKSKVKHMLKKAQDALQTLLDKGIAVAQNQYN